MRLLKRWYVFPDPGACGPPAACALPAAWSWDTCGAFKGKLRPGTLAAVPVLNSNSVPNCAPNSVLKSKPCLALCRSPCLATLTGKAVGGCSVMAGVERTGRMGRVWLAGQALRAVLRSTQPASQHNQHHSLGGSSTHENNALLSGR